MHYEAQDAKARAAKIRILIFDVDGTLTDGRIETSATGELFKQFHVRDGMGISLWHRVGLYTAIITGRTSVATQLRADELHISAVWQGCADKRVAYASLKAQFGVTDDEVGYVGDDLNDLPLLTVVGLAAAPCDAVEEVRARAHLIATKDGGCGAVREIIEYILKAQGRWAEIVKGFLPDATTMSATAQ